MKVKLVVLHQGPQWEAGEGPDLHHRIQGLGVPPGKSHHKQRQEELYRQLLQGRMAKTSFHSKLWSASSRSWVWAWTPVLKNLLWNESCRDVREQGNGWEFFSGQETWDTLLSLHPRGTQGRVRDILWTQSHSFGPTGTSSGRPSKRLGRQPWALSLPDKELCLRASAPFLAAVPQCFLQG